MQGNAPAKGVARFYLVMSDKKAVAKRALRSLNDVLIKQFDPQLMHGLYGESLLTEYEVQKIESEATPNDKNNRILSFLRKRGKEAEVLDTMIRLLEGDNGENKETNEVLLQKIEKAYRPFYSYSGDAANDGPPEVGAQQVPRGPSIQIQPLPKLEPVEQANGGKDLGLHKFSISQIVEGVDGGGKKRSDAYPMNSNPRGICVIINNENFTNMKARAGSYWDADALEKLFKTHLGFHIERFQDLTSKQIKQLMENIRDYDHSQLSCLVVCVLTHGVNGEIYGTDGVLVAVEDLSHTFTGSKCPTLLGKPKIFLLQACRGGKFDHGVKYEQTDDGEEKVIVDEKLVLGEEDETDGGGYRQALPDEADFLLAYATTPGFVSWRNSAFGTWFIKAFTDTMYEKAHEDHIMDILTEVNRKVAEEYHSREFKKQMPQPVTMLRYKLFLHPV